MEEIKFRIGNLELRIKSMPYPTLEIIQWNAELCWTIAYWSKRKEGNLELHFVSDRPFDERVNWKSLEILAKTGHEYIKEGQVA